MLRFRGGAHPKRALAEAGIRYFVVQLDAGDEETLRLLADEVMPHVG